MFFLKIILIFTGDLSHRRTLMKKKAVSKKSVQLHLFLFVFTFLIIGAFFVNSPTAKAATSNDDKPEVKLNVNSKSIVVDTTYTLKVYNLSDSYKVTFKSDSSDIASVDNDGVITANKVGDTFITVTVRDGFKTIASLKCTVAVRPSAKSVKFTRGEVTLSVEQKKYLKVTLIPNNTIEEAEFSSSDSSIVTVDSNGKITGVSKGTAYIYATIKNKDYAICKVTVVTEKTNSDDE
jgi:uncharacterized protein YjdB